MSRIVEKHEAPGRHPGVYTIRGRCKDCDRPMLSDWAWKILSPEAKAGYAKHRAKGLCDRHYARALRRQAGVPPRRKSEVRPLETVPVRVCKVCEAKMVDKRHKRQHRAALGHLKNTGARGMCDPCYRHWHDDGGPEREGLRIRRADEVLEEWEMIRDTGSTDVAQAAARLGMSTKALTQHLYRARKRGDLRGSLTPFGHDMRRAA